MNLGENIHSFRIACNMSQTDLADELSVSRQSVSKWENNSAQPELDKLCRMSELFDVTLDELVYGRRPQLPSGGTPVMNMSLSQLIPTRVLLGAAFVLSAIVFMLLSMFWGDRLRMGEVMGELLSVNLLLLGLSFVAAYNTRILATCGIAYFLFGIICYGIMNVTSLSSYLFMALAGIVLLGWFIKWGLHYEKIAQAA